MAELASLSGTEEATAWAHKRMAAKNTLAALDASLVEDAFARRLVELEAVGELEPAAVVPPAASTLRSDDQHTTATSISTETTSAPPSAPNDSPAWLGPPDPEPAVEPCGIDKSELPIGTPR